MVVSLTVTVTVDHHPITVSVSVTTMGKMAASKYLSIDDVNKTLYYKSLVRIATDIKYSTER